VLLLSTDFYVSICLEIFTSPYKFKISVGKLKNVNHLWVYNIQVLCLFDVYKLKKKSDVTFVFPFLHSNVIFKLLPIQLTEKKKKKIKIFFPDVKKNKLFS